jgi:hypothetical protein
LQKQLEGVLKQIPIGNREILLAAVYKSPGLTCSDTDITELLSFRNKFILQVI